MTIKFNSLEHAVSVLASRNVIERLADKIVLRVENYEYRGIVYQAVDFLGHNVETGWKRGTMTNGNRHYYLSLPLQKKQKIENREDDSF